MLKITVPSKEWFDEETWEFIESPKTTLILEHSLISLSKWESIWEKPFLNSKASLGRKELVDYVRCMTIQPKNIDPLVYRAIYEDESLLEAVSNYINKSMTATWFSDKENKAYGPNKPVTSEEIYYYMCKLNIPVEFEKWHLNRLMTLIQVFNAKDAPPKKRNREEFLSSRRALNEKRKKALHSRG